MNIKRIAMTSAACAALLVIPLSAFAQTSTQTGLVNAAGQASSNSSSAANALSVSQGGGGGAATATGGNARARGGNSNANNQASVTFNQPGVTTSTNSAITRNRSSGSLRTTANAFAPALVASAVGTCLGSVSSGVGATGFGFSFGTTVPDKSCDIRMFSEALLKAGQRNAATAILCRDRNVYDAFVAVGITCPLVPDGYQIVGQPPGTQPYQLVQGEFITGVPEAQPATRRARIRRQTNAVIPTGRGEYIPAPQSMNTVGPTMADRVNLEQAEASAAAARLKEEYAREKSLCEMTGGVAC